MYNIIAFLKKIFFKRAIIQTDSSIQWMNQHTNQFQLVLPTMLKLVVAPSTLNNAVGE